MTLLYFIVKFPIVIFRKNVLITGMFSPFLTFYVAETCFFSETVFTMVSIRFFLISVQNCQPWFVHIYFRKSKCSQFCFHWSLDTGKCISLRCYLLRQDVCMNSNRITANREMDSLVEKHGFKAKHNIHSSGHILGHVCLNMISANYSHFINPKVCYKSKGML